MEQTYPSKTKFYVFLFSFLLSLGITAQTTSIPDANFEQILIDEGIDSDGVINGQVLTSDINTVLSLELQWVENLTGLEDFIALEYLILEEGGDYGSNLSVDLTFNPNLREVEIFSFEGLKNLDVSGLSNLEKLVVAELQDDVTTMPIEVLDLSTNPNIDHVEAGYLENITEINLQNGNNINMVNMLIDVMFYTNIPVCIKVDDAAAASANTSPYVNWTIYGVNPTFYDSGSCTLSVNEVNKLNMAIYPNPTQNNFQIQTSEKIDEVHVFSITGKHLAKFRSQENYDISQLPTGVYFVKVKSNRKKSLQRIVKR